MKPSRKLNRGSFMSRVSGSGGPKPAGGQGKGAAAAFERLVAAPAMEQRLGGAAIQ